MLDMDKVLDELIQQEKGIESVQENFNTEKAIEEPQEESTPKKKRTRRKKSEQTQTNSDDIKSLVDSASVPLTNTEMEIVKFIMRYGKYSMSGAGAEEYPVLTSARVLAKHLNVHEGTVTRALKKLQYIQSIYVLKTSFGHLYSTRPIKYKTGMFITICDIEE